MGEVIFSESAYRFTDPIRTFKANDPYYYEVDNIPLRQLEENCLWLKDQLTGGPIEIKNIPRRELAELRPEVTGSDRVVKVNTGRYTARVNDAYFIQPLASLKRFLENAEGVDSYSGQNFLDGADTKSGEWGYVIRDGGGGAQGLEGYALAPNDLNTLLNKWREESAITASDDVYTEQNGLQRKQQSRFGFNGLSERAFAYPTKNSIESILRDFSSSAGMPTIGEEGDVADSGGFVQRLQGAKDVPFPVFEALLWDKVVGSTGERKIEAFNWPNEARGFLYLPRLENQLIRRWRGIARTAVVDIPNPLEITIPPFDENDFFYTSTAQNKELKNGTVRVDLLFIYSKPVDVEKTTIVNPGAAGGSQLEHINTPKLGIVKGAGLGIDETNSSPGEGTTDSEGSDRAGAINGYDANTGYLKILADYRDEESIENGFKNITQADEDDTQYSVHASFPVPDDLLNLAPALLESLEGTEWDLVGQSVLPIAYIVSRKGQGALEERDLVDIRPFFRTTELTYNERAGIAAAYPPLSLANPAVGKRDLDRVEKGIRDGIGELFPTLVDLVNGRLSVLPIPKPRLCCRLDALPNQEPERLLEIKDFSPYNNTVGNDFNANGYAPGTQVFTLRDEPDAHGTTTERVAVEFGIGGLYEIEFNLMGQPRQIDTGSTIPRFEVDIVNYQDGDPGASRVLEDATDTNPRVLNDFYVYPTQDDIDVGWANGHPMNFKVGADNDDFEIGGSANFKKIMLIEDPEPGQVRRVSIKLRGSTGPSEDFYFQGYLNIVRIANKGGDEGTADPTT